MTAGAIGYVLSLTLVAGANYIPQSNGAWVSGNFVGAVGQDNFASNQVGTTFDVAFVQHEPGTSFGGIIDLSFTKNLEDCCRYYQKNGPYATAACQGNYIQVGAVAAANTTTIRSSVQFSPRMAKTPTMRMTGSTTTLGQVYIDGVGNVALAASPFGVRDSGIFNLILNANTAAAAGSCVLGDWDADTGW